MITLGFDPAQSHHDRLVDLLGPLVPAREPPQWVHRRHGRAVAGSYERAAPQLFELTSDLHRCDVAVLPFGWDQVLLEPGLRAPAVAFCVAARAAGKIVLVFVDGDDHVPAPADNTVVFRTSLDRRHKGPRDVALPAWIPDPGRQPPRPYTERAVVGFCGQAYPLDLAPTRVAKRAKFHGRVALTRLGVVERLGKHPAFAIRPRVVRALQRTRDVDASITLRSSMTRLDLDTRNEHDLYAEYVRSLTDSDYVLCVRGEGNYSFRLYEALAAGRIPLYVDTDAVLPLESRVPWRELCVVVAARDARHIGAAVATAHAELDAGQFATRQAACRDAWEHSLSMQGYFEVVHAQLTRLLDEGPLDPVQVAAALS